MTDIKHILTNLPDADKLIIEAYIKSLQDEANRLDHKLQEYREVFNRVKELMQPEENVYKLSHTEAGFGEVSY